MNNRFLLFGYALFFSGILLFGIMHLAIAIHIPDLTSWSRQYGMLPSVLNEIIGWVPYVMSIVLLIIGASMIIYDLWKAQQSEQASGKNAMEILYEQEKEEER